MAIFEVAGVGCSCWEARRISEREAAVTRSRDTSVAIFGRNGGRWEGMVYRVDGWPSRRKVFEDNAGWWETGGCLGWMVGLGTHPREP